MIQNILFGERATSCRNSQQISNNVSVLLFDRFDPRRFTRCQNRKITYIQ
jgi:hypothetical protein